MMSISQHPRNPRRWGLKNCSDQEWRYQVKDGPERVVQPGQSMPLRVGLKIELGNRQVQVYRL